MLCVDRFRLRLRTLFRREQVEQELDEEIRYHLERQIEQNISAGMSPADARQAARRDFGGLEQLKEECRDQRELALLESILQDLRYAVRAMWQNPGFTTVVLISLALGIGVNTAVFSLVYAVLLKPLPNTDSDRIVTIWSFSQKAEERASEGVGYNPPRWRLWGVSPPNLQDLVEQTETLDNTAALRHIRLFLSGTDRPFRLEAGEVTTGFFEILGVRPALGRLFDENDFEQRSRVAVLSHAAWRECFGGAPAIVGTEIILSGQTFTVIGVLSRGAGYRVDTQVWTPLVLADQDYRREAHFLNVVARLKPGVPLEQARTELRTIFDRLEQQYPDPNNIEPVVRPLREVWEGEARTGLLTLFGAVSLVLLIACANVAGLQLGRGAARTREIALRQALGAGRRRLIRQLLTESTLLSLCGGVAGLLLAFLLISAGRPLLPPGLIPTDEITPHWQVLWYTVSLSVITGLAFGLVPALKLAGTARESLHEGRGVAGGTASARLRGMLVTAQLAISVVLLLGSALMLATFWNLSNVDKGFDADQVATMHFHLPPFRYPEDRLLPYAEEMLSRVRNLPGVTSAAIVDRLPLGGGITLSSFAIPGRPELSEGRAPVTNYRVASVDYFRTMRIPLLHGRPFNERDRLESPPVAIVNLSMAERYWPEESAIGRTIRFLHDEVDREIVGVVGGIRHMQLSRDGGTEVYVPMAQHPPRHFNVMVRTTVAPRTLLPMVQQEIWKVDPDQPLLNPRTMGDVVGASEAERRFQGALLIVLGGVALTLALVGVYGVVSWTVTRRTHEIGIRMALGAQRREVLAMMIGQGLRVGLAGTGVGIVAATVLTRPLSDQLYGISLADPAIYAVVCGLLLVVTALASYIPGRRAAGVDPMVALRHE